MTTSQIFLVTSTFLACAVEMVEALTIVLATGIIWGWRSALIGTLAALVTLAVIVAIWVWRLLWFRSHSMQLVVGALTLIFGLQRLRKAILRSASGRKAMHDDGCNFRGRASRSAQDLPVTSGLASDRYSFTICFKGVFLKD
jgi:uncharacterized membrane protein